jgi:hypothetical protein
MTATVTALRELDIKAALIDFLIEGGLIERNSVIVPEMRALTGERRVDLVVASDHTQAYEIKSDGDRLGRLSGQLEAMIARFEAVTVVATERHMEEIKRSISRRVGLILVKVVDGSVSFKIIRNAIVKRVVKRFWLSFLTVQEIRAALKTCGIKALSKLNRVKLEKLTEAISVAFIKETVLSTIKKKFGELFNNFLKAKSGATNKESLNLLNRGSVKQDNNNVIFSQKKPDSSIFIPVIVFGNKRLLVARRS